VLWVRENAKAMRRTNDKLSVLIAYEDITERKQTENALRQSETYLAEAQRLSLTGSFGWRVTTGELTWSSETFRIFQCDRATKPTLEFIAQRTHPEGRAAVRKTIEEASGTGEDFDHEYRLLMPGASAARISGRRRASPEGIRGERGTQTL
jgi:PAS domain-containing protein